MDSHLRKPTMNVDASRHAILLGKENEHPAAHGADGTSERPSWSKPLPRHTLQSITNKTVTRTGEGATASAAASKTKADNQPLIEDEETGQVIELLRTLQKKEQEIDAQLEIARSEQEQLRVAFIQDEKQFQEKEQERVDALIEERRQEKLELTQKIDAEREKLSKLSDRLLELHNECSRSVALRSQKESILRKEELKSEQAKENIANNQDTLSKLQAEQTEFNASMKLKEEERRKLSQLSKTMAADVEALEKAASAAAEQIESTRIKKGTLERDLAALDSEVLFIKQKNARGETDLQDALAELERRQGSMLKADAGLNESKDLQHLEQGRREKLIACEGAVKEFLKELHQRHAQELVVLQTRAQVLEEEHKKKLAEQEVEFHALMAALQECDDALSVAMQAEEEIETALMKMRTLLETEKAALLGRKNNEEIIMRELQMSRDELFAEEQKGVLEADQLSAKIAELASTKSCVQKLELDIEECRVKVKNAEALDKNLRVKYTAEKEQLNSAIHELEQTQAIELNAFQSRQQDMLLRQRDALKDLHETEKANEALQLELDGVVSALEVTEKNLEKLRLRMSLEREEVDRLEGDSRAFHELQLAQQVRAKEYELKIIQEEQQRRYLHNMVQELKGNIRVFCRVRPDLSSSGNGVILIDDSARALVVRSGTQDAKAKAQLRTTVVEKRFEFDRIFGQLSTQDDVFDEISQVVQSALDGYRVCLFAYGQTGSGKTHTMIGSKEHPGVIPRSIRKIFSCANTLSDQGWSFELQVAFIEIYNERVRDLLSSNRAQKCELKPRMDSLGYNVTNLTHETVNNERQVLMLLEHAMKNRMTASTKMNEHSSRSHSIFRLFIHGKNSITGQELDGALNLVDLAGSERLDKSGAVDKDRREEAKFINLSLTTLNQCIMGLAQASGHIKYRDSKLTQLLQDSLGGNSKTIMFVNVSPAFDNRQETLCSLQFGQSVNACEIGTAQRKTLVNFDDL
ncbi:Kinesin-like protein KIN-14N [Porphyridium purpureum]|uniref:Kinesin-like protein KIN-14N n=1 Tax=Porphyridium purpureum TaxID=35688 RepID=A0A5J4YP73_PORPP|nr:Kinesin-like protein KIN-14N [Porphyridium purpureum]|eukprot:POR6845..scf295_9